MSQTNPSPQSKQAETFASKSDSLVKDLALVNKAEAWAVESKEEDSLAAFLPTTTKSEKGPEAKENPVLLALTNAITEFVTDEIVKRLGFPAKEEEKKEGNQGSSASSSSSI